MVRATNAIHRKTSTMTCGMTRTHLTSHRQRLRGSSRSPSTCSGYVDGAACSFMARTPLESACRRGGSDPFVGSEAPRTDLLLCPVYCGPGGAGSGVRGQEARERCDVVAAMVALVVDAVAGDAARAITTSGCEMARRSAWRI